VSDFDEGGRRAAPPLAAGLSGTLLLFSTRTSHIVPSALAARCGGLAPGYAYSVPGRLLGCLDGQMRHQSVGGRQTWVLRGFGGGLLGSALTLASLSSLRVAVAAPAAPWVRRIVVSSPPGIRRWTSRGEVGAWVAIGLRRVD
jgi:hypothetical protein